MANLIDETQVDEVKSYKKEPILCFDSSIYTN